MLFVCFIGCGGDRAEAPSFNPDRPEEKEWVPEIVPYLDSQPSEKDGRGIATISSSGPFPASSLQKLKIDFTVGEGGIVPGGFILLQVSPWWGWSSPQNRFPEGKGYFRVDTSFSSPEPEVRVLPLNRVMVFSRKSPIPAGGKITFSFPEIRVDRFAEAEELFQIFTDGDGDGHSASIPDPPTVVTEAHQAVRLEISSPSHVQPEKKLTITAAPLDRIGNWSELPAGEYILEISRDGEKTGRERRTVKRKEKVLSFDYHPEKEGIYFFRVNGPGDLSGVSNVTHCREGTPSLKLYFGDIHGHSRLSDGTGTPKDYYRYARFVSGLQVAALTDHADYGTIPIKGKVWERIKEAANRAYDPGRFVTFIAFEWTNWKYGHRNVYYRGDDGPVFRSLDPESDTPTELWEKIRPYRAMTVAHHVGGGPVATDWSIPPGPREWLVEIASIHGSSEYYGCEKSIYRPVKGAFVRDALSRGYRLGIIGGGDTHDGHPGQRSVGAPIGGLMGVYAAGLTREEIWDAFEKRRVYATSGPKMIVNFRAADSPMGSETEWSLSSGPIPIVFRVIGCDEIERVEIIRNGTTVFSQPGKGVVIREAVEDPSPPPGVSWYYLKAVQKDGNMAWAGPIWVDVKSSD